MEKSNFRLLAQIKVSLILLFSLVIFSCEPDSINEQEAIQVLNLNTQKKVNSEKFNEFYGPAKFMGNGVVRSFVTINKSGIPVSVGIIFSEKVLENLPHEDSNITLELHKKAGNLIVNHIDFGFNPEGHPGPVFMVEHFDVHFYWISPEEKNAIPFKTGLEDLPLPVTHPDFYVYDFATVPAMGRHWILSSQNSSLEFDQTFIYGSWNSKFTFYEPMITLEYLKNKEFEESYNIIPLGQYEDPGYYANSYKISYDPVKKQYRVLLTDLFLAGGAF